ncbi:MAG: MFS transporter, partial [Vicinamibacterales bacterium]
MTVGVQPARSTAAFVAAFVLTGMVTTVLGPILPELLIAWHLTDAAGGALFSAQFTGSVTAGLISGLIVARLGDARTLAIGYALMTVGLLGLAGGSYAWGVTGACLVGLGMGCVIPPTNLLIARARPERAAAALGGLNFAWGLGASAWPLIVSSVVPVAGLRPPLVTLALLCGIAAVGIGTRASPVRQHTAAEDQPISLSASRILL